MRKNKSFKIVIETCFNEVKGITLIALIVSIIVVLILAGVTISTLTGDNRIINKSNKF